VRTVPIRSDRNPPLSPYGDGDRFGGAAAAGLGDVGEQAAAIDEGARQVVGIDDADQQAGAVEVALDQVLGRVRVGAAGLDQGAEVIGGAGEGAAAGRGEELGGQAVAVDVEDAARDRDDLVEAGQGPAVTEGVAGAVGGGKTSIEEWRQRLRFYETGLEGYTYLEEPKRSLFFARCRPAGGGCGGRPSSPPATRLRSGFGGPCEVQGRKRNCVCKLLFAFLFGKIVSVPGRHPPSSSLRGAVFDAAPKCCRHPRLSKRRLRPEQPALLPPHSGGNESNRVRERPNVCYETRLSGLRAGRVSCRPPRSRCRRRRW
jgi:hypothetical protein